MANFLDAFPVTNYNISGRRYSSTITVCNVLYRVAFIRNILSNASTYLTYVIRDFDRPEMIADKIYGDPTAHWMIILANNIMNPLTDWPLDQRSFNKYITTKYGSISLAQTTIHHYEKVITSLHNASGTESIRSFIIDGSPKTTNTSPSLVNVPYETYDTLPEYTYNVYDLEDSTVYETITKREVSNFEYEQNLNEERRNIRIVKPEYYPQILDEFKKLTDSYQVPVRRFS